MPENEFNSYTCYLANKSKQNNCVVNTPSGKNVTYFSSGFYTSKLYCRHHCPS